MNGREYDLVMEAIELVRALEDTDVEMFCKKVRDLEREERLFDYILFLNEPKILQSKIAQKMYDEEAVKAARVVCDLIYQDYKRSLLRQIDKYSTSIERQIEKYKRSLLVLKILQQVLQFFTIVGAVLVPFIINVPEISKIVPTVMSALVAVSAALTKYYKFGDRYTTLFQITEKWQKEYNLHLSRRGPYSTLKAGAALDLFMDRIDELKHEQNELTLSLEKTIQDENRQLEQERVKK